MNGEKLLKYNTDGYLPHLGRAGERRILAARSSEDSGRLRFTNEIFFYPLKPTNDGGTPLLDLTSACQHQQELKDSFLECACVKDGFDFCAIRTANFFR